MTPGAEEDLRTHDRGCRCPPCRVEAHRTVEERGFYVGLFVAGLFSLGEFLVYVGVVAPAAGRGIPWLTVMFFAGCVLPITIGKATTGRAWITIANGIANWLSNRKNGSSPPPPPPPA